MNERDLIQHISTLRNIAGRLRAVAAQVPDKRDKVVAIDPKGAAENADLLDEVADDLIGLVPEKKVTLK